MRKKRILIVVAIAISIAALGLIVYVDELILAGRERITFNVDSETLDTISGIRFLFPADENRGLSSDIYASIFREDELHHYVILSEDVKEHGLICYAEDSKGRLLKRFSVDFDENGEYKVGLRTLHFVQTKLPIMTIDIDKESPTFEDLLASDKTVECYGDLTLSVNEGLAHKNHWIEEIHSENRTASTDGSVILKGRGNASWYDSPKKSFTIAFEKATYMLGLGKNKKWNLISNASDKSLLKNEIFLNMSSDMGVMYEPGCEQVTLFVNGEYQGVYLLTSKVSVDKKRVDLEREDLFFCWGPTGADQPLFYESETWMDDGGDYAEPFVNLEWPEEASDKTLDKALTIAQRFISTMEDVNDSSYSEYMDAQSMARYYWAQEISMNYDAAFRSTYSYYTADDGKMYMGPVWDLDLSIGWNAEKGNADYSDPTGWKLRGLSWYVPLFEREEFRQVVSDVYFNGGIREEMYKALENYENKAAEMAVDGQLNYQRWWSDKASLGIFYGSSYEEQAAGDIEFFRRRVEWIDEQMQSGF